MQQSRAEYLTEDYEEVLDESGKDLLKRLENSSQRAIYFVDKLLEYGSLNAKETLHAIDLNDVVEIACDTLIEPIVDTSTTFFFGDLPTVMGLEIQLIQLFQNLIGNAIKYRARDRSPQIDIQATSIAGKEWKIWVKDNGMGIPVEHQQNIFDILYRLHGSDYDGAGIGLATCKWIVHNHFGTIGVESQVGAGSCFYFTLRSADEIPTID